MNAQLISKAKTLLEVVRLNRQRDGELSSVLIGLDCADGAAARVVGLDDLMSKSKDLTRWTIVQFVRQFKPAALLTVFECWILVAPSVDTNVEELLDGGAVRDHPDRQDAAIVVLETLDNESVSWVALVDQATGTIGEWEQSETGVNVEGRFSGIFKEAYKE